jgi:hypothetical protein
VILDYALLADDATAIDGRLYVHGGGLRVVIVPQIPWVIHFALAARFAAELDEVGDDHTIALRIWEPDGQPVYLVDAASFRLDASNLAVEDDRELQLLTSFRIGALVLRETGWYSVELALDGDTVASLPFRVQVV